MWPIPVKVRRWRPVALLTLLLVVIVLVASLLVRHRQAGQGDENVSRVVRTTAIAVRDVPVFLNAVGTVTPSTTVIVRAQVQGTLASINFREWTAQPFVDTRRP